jgi:membrane associated rhomboid family serine protease
MKTVLRTWFSSIPFGMRLLLVIYGISWPLTYLGLATGAFNLLYWSGLNPVKVWHGEVWRLVTYSLVAGRPISWILNFIWLAMMISVLKQDWSSKRFWAFIVVSALGGALPFVLLFPTRGALILDSGGVILGLIIAWARFHGRERVVMLGIGEMSVRQAAIFLAALDLTMTYLSCGGLLFTISMACGGLVAWIYLVLGSKLVLGRSSSVAESKRMARLEL